MNIFQIGLWIDDSILAVGWLFILFCLVVIVGVGYYVYEDTKK